MQSIATREGSHRPVFVGLFAAAAITVGFSINRVGSAPPKEVAETRDLQTAVLSGGFVVLEGTRTDRHVIETDRDGALAGRRAVPVIAPHARVLGTSAGTAMAWLGGDKVSLALVTGDGKLGEVSKWGKKATQLCDGTASNALRWGVGWLEKDGRVWVLHGPTGKRAQALGSDAELLTESTATATTWCGVTSAGTNIALVWRESGNRTFINFCGQKGCDSDVYRVPVGPKHQLAGIACTQSSCLVALRDDAGKAHLGWMTAKGKVVWSKALTDATPESEFSLVAAGANAFAVGYTANEGATVTRVIESGSMVRAWADPYSHATPALAWANDRLLVAHRHDQGSVAPEVVPLPQ
ncbi:MAG: hypothetical protein H0T46_33510 [Deltaproteobacteria bacterium]|nr:hypothetical protein [Deltaproteobacteria bacterium]